jgi:tetratricopeptide (TPR) repeat protein
MDGSSLADIRAAVERAEAALGVDDVPGAVRIASEAVSAGLEAPLLLNLAAYGLELKYEFQESLNLLQRAHVMSPGDPLILNAIGQSLSQQGRVEDARDAYEAALRIDPVLAPAHYGLGLAYELLNDEDLAWVCLERAIQFAPEFADPIGSLAGLAVKRKDFELARALAERALAIDPLQPAANLGLASVEFDAGDMDAAEQRLLPLVRKGAMAPLHQASVWRRLADIYDATGRPKEAFEAYAASNELVRMIYKSHFVEPGGEMGVEMCARLADYFRASPKKVWQAKPAAKLPAGPAKGHVFLVGFPRSGTTLLEQVLASHPEVVALEERPTISPMVWDFFKDAEGLDRLTKLTDVEIAELRETYWANVRSFGVEPEGKVFVDKMPLTTIWIPLIARLFPDAGILLVRRDPRDVVWSCLRRRFKQNAFMYEFTDVVRAAQFYSGVMTLAEIYQEKVPLRFHIHVHEQLIANFDAETRALCDFMGVPWTERMRDFVATAKSRDVRTPSAPQIMKGLNASGVAQWRDYAEGLAPAMPYLAQWVEKFGYADV